MHKIRLTLPTTACILALAGCSGGGERTTDGTSDTATTGITSITGSATESGTDSATAGSATGTSGMTDGQTDTGTAGASTGMECGEAMVEPMAVPPNVILVLDKSGSMVANTWDHDQNPMTPDVTRWQSLHAVVTNIANNFDAAINLGMQLFPSLAAQNTYGAAACTVEATPEVPVQPMNGAAVLAAMPPANADSSIIKGGTPATAAIVAASDHLKTLDAQIPRAIILVTDGAANCGGTTDQEKMELYDEQLPVVVGDLYQNDGIPTYVVGIDMKNEIVGCGTGSNVDNCGECSNNPNTVCDEDTDCGAGNTCEPFVGKCSMTTSDLCANDMGCPMGETCSPQPVGIDGSPLANPWKRLNDVAMAGGVPKNGGMDPEKFYNATNEAELQAALDAIAGAVISCTVPLDPPPEPIQENWTEIEVDGMVWPKVMDCATEDGWMFTQPDLSEIQLCGAACDAFKAAGGALDATYGCPPAG
ncbi:MAG: VWA domain-containing protein [Deltaproteobacteria bacterium]|nr:MAG: VWA domain-containing protein [Deltaproteobacteria bacterium]